MDLKIQDFLKNDLNRNINAYEVSRRKQELIELSYKYCVTEEKFNSKYKNTKNIIFKLNAIRLVIAIITLTIGVLTSFWIKNNTLCVINASVCWLNLLSFIPTKLIEHKLKTDKSLLNDFYYDVKIALLRYSLAFQDLKSKNAVNAYNDIYKILEKLCEKNSKNKKEIRVYLLYLTTGANKWLNMPKENLTDTCEEKEHFDNLTDRISEALDTEIEITGISFLGFNNIAAYITFTIKNDFFDREFELTIPDTEKLHKNNLLELDYGKVKLCVRDYVNTSVWNSICSSYILSDLQAKFKDFITPKPV